MYKPSKGIEVEIETITSFTTDAHPTMSGTYRGQLYLTGGESYILRYEEGEAKQTVQTTVKIQPSEVKLIRHGFQKMNHRFVPGKTTQSVYQTPFANMAMETETTELVWAWHGDAGSLTLSYRLTLGGQYVDDLTLQIRLTKIIS